MPRTRTNLMLLARVRRSLRSLSSAIARGAEEQDLTLQQQAFLLALAAYGGEQVPFADIREELEMDRATASVLLRRLVAMRLVATNPAADRRAVRLSLTPRGRVIFARSIESIGREIAAAEHRQELGALSRDLRRYMAFYLAPRQRGARRVRRGSPAR